MPDPDLVRTLNAKSGNPYHHEHDWLDEDAREYLQEQTRRLYEEYLGAVREELGEDDPPEEDELEQAALTHIMGLILETGYELGLESAAIDEHTKTISLDEETEDMLLRFALRKLLEE